MAVQSHAGHARRRQRHLGDRTLPRPGDRLPVAGGQSQDRRQQQGFGTPGNPPEHLHEPPPIARLGQRPSVVQRGAVGLPCTGGQIKTITGYLSVVSKGAAAFALCSILMHVFGVLLEQWQYLLSIVIVLSITIANLF